MGDRLQDVLQAMQMARARARQGTPNQAPATTHQADIQQTLVGARQEDWSPLEGQTGQMGGGRGGRSSWQHDVLQETRFESAGPRAAAVEQERQQQLQVQLRMEHLQQQQLQLRRELQQKHLQQGGAVGSRPSGSGLGPGAVSGNPQLQLQSHESALALRSPERRQQDRLKPGSIAAPGEHPLRQDHRQQPVQLGGQQRQQETLQRQQQQQEILYLQQQQLLRQQLQQAQVQAQPQGQGVVWKGRRNGSPEEVVDLTSEDDREDGGQAQGPQKRRCPESFLSNGAASKRPAPGPREAFPSEAGQQRQQQLLQQQLQQLEADIRQAVARELQQLQHLQPLLSSLRSGTFPLSPESRETRPLTAEERQKLEGAAMKLQEKIGALKQERLQLVARQQQVQQQLAAWGAEGGGAGGKRNGASDRSQEVQGPMSLAPALQERLRSMATPNGGTRGRVGAPPSMVVTTGMGGSSAAGTTATGAKAGPGPSSTAVVTSLGAQGPGAAPGTSKAVAQGQGIARDGGQIQRVTEHQQALRAMIESLQATGTEELEPPPKTLQVTVLRHQRMALAWMIRRETGSEPRGGILADDQGLGKTVTTISLIVTHTTPEECARLSGGAAAGSGGAAGAGAGGSRAGAGVAGEQVQVEVESLLDDDDEDDLGAEEESEENTDPFGVRLGALRAEREAAGVADAAEAGAAAADMLWVGTPPAAAPAGSGSGSGVTPPSVKVLPLEAAAAAEEQPLAGAPPQPHLVVAAQAKEGAASAQSAAAMAAAKEEVKMEPAGGGGAGSSPPVCVDLVEDDVLPPSAVHSQGPECGGAAVMSSEPTAGLDPDIIAMSESGPAAVAAAVAAAAAAGPPPNLPPAAAGSLSHLASANLAAAVLPVTERLLESQRQRQVATTGNALGPHVHAHGKPLYEPEPPNLLLGGTLVVCPTSVLHQWAREIRDKVSPAAGLVVHVYHGKDRVSTVKQLSGMGVVLTTYGTLAQEAPSRDKQAVRLGRQGTSAAPINLAADDSGGDEPVGGQGAGGRGKGGGRPRSTKPASAEGGLLYQIKWRRVVLDEAQSIKNPRTLAAHAAWRLFAHCRWCLSGTPIQNTVDDLYSYFRFLRYAPYCESRTFRELIKGKIAERPEIGYKFLQAVLQAVLLRRTKQSTINGEPIIKLPPRQQQLLREKFSAAEAAFYSQVQAESLRALHEAGEGGANGSRQYVNMLHSLLKLRQACNHPWLVRGGRTAWHKTGNPSASEVEAARKLSPQARAVLVRALSRGDAQCPCCGDIAEDPVASACGHVFCAQCLAAQREGASVEGELLCPACSSLLRGGDLHSAAALAAVDPAALPSGGGRSADGAGAGKGEDGGEWVSSAKVERLLALLEGLRSKNTAAAQQATAAARAANPLAVKSKSDKRMAGALRKLPPLPSLPGGGGGVPGVKPDKVIVFSQWTSMLDLLEIPMKRAKIQFRRLDGTMSVGNREKAIQDFESRPEVMVLLVSLKAAALGVNLTVANHVVLMDLWWNPTTEEQAIDRAHRIGQTRTVQVTRITIAGSVEDRILQLQQAKREVVAAALSEGRDGSAAAGRLTLEDLRFLFQGLAQ